MYKNLAKSWMHDKIVDGSSLGNSPEREQPRSADCAKHTKEESWFDVDQTPLGKLLTEIATSKIELSLALTIESTNLKHPIYMY